MDTKFTHVKFGDYAEIMAYTDGWELHVLRDKQPTRLQPELKPGKVRKKTYHGTMEQACKALVAQRLKEMGDTDAASIIAAVEKSTEDIVAALKAV